MAGNSCSGRKSQQQGLAKTKSIQDGGKNWPEKDPKAHYIIIIMTPQVEGGLRRTNIRALSEQAILGTRPRCPLPPKGGVIIWHLEVQKQHDPWKHKLRKTD